MQIRYLKYILISAFVGALLWIILIELDYRSGLEIFRVLDPSYLILDVPPVYPILGLIAIVIGTYIGLWSIGKIRKPSFLHGILLGLLSFVLYIPLSLLVGWIYCAGSGDLPWFTRRLGEHLVWKVSSVGWIIGLVAGILGVAIIRRISPSFCPNCGNKLPLGRDPCPKCGTNP